MVVPMSPDFPTINSRVGVCSSAGLDLYMRVVCTGVWPRRCQLLCINSQDILLICTCCQCYAAHVETSFNMFGLVPVASSQFLLRLNCWKQALHASWTLLCMCSGYCIAR